jgi:hypothetical protein
MVVWADVRALVTAVLMLVPRVVLMIVVGVVIILAMVAVAVAMVPAAVRVLAVIHPAPAVRGAVRAVHRLARRYATLLVPTLAARPAKAGR